ncbi:hypothetical protein KCP76_06115 [Salmonella enterica subsp. enterica serovar Weltevreden]|nr:hypothetical protein KCP76_06115 [Salmonella enterica subsp. enterica serovar Weltevreden]
MRQHQLTASPVQYAAAIHKPLFILMVRCFVIQCGSRRSLFCATISSFFSFWFSSFSPLMTLSLLRHFLLHIGGALIHDGINIVEFIGQRFDLIFRIRHAGKLA